MLMATARELHEARCERALVRSMGSPGVPLHLPHGHCLELSSATGVECGSVLWEGTHALLSYLGTLPPSFFAGERVLDLGCGIGGLGLACACFGAASVVLTDHKPALLKLALHNINANGKGARCAAQHLEWGKNGWEAFKSGEAFSPPTLLVGADLVYTAEGAELLCETIACALAYGGSQQYKMLLSYKERGQGAVFFSALASSGLACREVSTLGDHRVYAITGRH